MPELSEILSPSRTVCRIAGGSKKRLFETIARIFADDQPGLEYAAVLDQLIAREKLGSTGLGEGIAIPHCRVEDCPEPLASLVTLEEPIAYDAPDEQPVDLLFILLVPAEENQEHLDILATIARACSQQSFCAKLRSATDAQALLAAASEAAQ